MPFRFRKILTLILFVLILTQCSDKNSGEYVQEGLEYLNHEQYDSARESFLKAIEKDAKNPEGYYGLGGIYNYQKNFKKAEQAFKSVLKIDPIHKNAWYSLVFTYELMGKKEEAEESYKKYRRLKGKMDSLMSQEKHWDLSLLLSLFLSGRVLADLQKNIESDIQDPTMLNATIKNIQISWFEQ